MKKCAECGGELLAGRGPLAKLKVDADVNDALDLPAGSPICYFCYNVIGRVSMTFFEGGAIHCEKRALH